MTLKGSTKYPHSVDLTPAMQARWLQYKAMHPLHSFRGVIVDFLDQLLPTLDNETPSE
jgi:hypothetical protein